MEQARLAAWRRFLDVDGELDARQWLRSHMRRLDEAYGDLEYFERWMRSAPDEELARELRASLAALGEAIERLDDIALWFGAGSEGS